MIIGRSSESDTWKQTKNLTCRRSEPLGLNISYHTTLALTFGPKQSKVCQLGQIFVDESIWKSLKSPPALKGCNKQ